MDNALRKPMLLCFAGPNGSGKSTITKFFEIAGEYTNADDVVSSTGMENKDLSVALSRLTRLRFIKHKGYDIIPTERFRRGLSAIERNTYAPRLGEINVQVPVDEDEYPIPF